VVLALFKKNSRIGSFLGLALLLLGLMINSSMHGADFEVFYKAGQRFIQHLPLYQEADGWSPFKYHPSWAIIFSFWSLLPFSVSVVLFNTVNVLFWGVAAHKWSKWLGYDLKVQNIFILLMLSLNALSAETA